MPLICQKSGLSAFILAIELLFCLRKLFFQHIVFVKGRMTDALCGVWRVALGIKKPMGQAHKHPTADDIAKSDWNEVFNNEALPCEHRRYVCRISQLGDHFRRHHAVAQYADGDHEHIGDTVFKATGDEQAHGKKAGGHLVEE